MPNTASVTAPILVVGPGRSGSSWLMHVLNQHPDVQGLIENRVVEAVYHEVFHSFWAKNWSWVCDSEEQHLRAVRTARAALCELFPTDRPRWTMKMIARGRPWDFVRAVFPEARYIHLTRSPTTAVVSMSEFFGESYPIWKDLEYAEAEFIASHQEALQVAVNGLPYLQVRQEDVAADAMEQWRRILEFCGLRSIVVPGLEQEVNAAPATRGKIRAGRPPLPWNQFKPETLRISQQLGYLPRETTQGDDTQSDLAAAGLRQQLEAAQAECQGLAARLNRVEHERAAAQLDMQALRATLSRLTAEADIAGPGFAQALCDVRNLLAARNSAAAEAGGGLPVEAPAEESSAVRVDGVDVLNAAGVPCSTFELGDSLNIQVRFTALQNLEALSVSYLILDDNGSALLGTCSFDEYISLPNLRTGEALAVRFGLTNALRPGNFGVSVSINRVRCRDYSDDHRYALLHRCAVFTSLRNPERPVHYRFHAPVTVSHQVSRPATPPQHAVAAS